MQLGLIFGAACFMLFDHVQIFLAERFYGIKVIRSGADPRELMNAWPSWVAVLWFVFYFAYWPFMVHLIFVPGYAVHGAALLGLSIVGAGLRRISSVKWILVLLTLEGAVRIGLLGNMAFSEIKKVWV